MLRFSQIPVRLRMLIDDKPGEEVRMKFFGIVPFLLFVVVSGSLFAQSTGGTTGTGLGDSTLQVENQSELGGFIGSGRPTGFVGVDEIYDTTSSARRSSSSSSSRSSRLTTTARPRTATSASQRQQGAARACSAFGNIDTQTVRSITTLDADMVVPHVRRSPTVGKMQLTRIRGLQDCQVSFATSPKGTTAVLTGTVASERERRVAQQLLLLEPGINRVENLLRVR